MVDTGRLEADPLFLGLTRPPMMAGVSYSWFMLNGMIWNLYFINTSDLGTFIPGFAFCHLIGYIICSKEPRFMDIWITKVQRCLKGSKNAGYHGGTQSYDFY